MLSIMYRNQSIHSQCKVVAIEEAPFVTVVDTDRQGQPVYSGFMVEVLDLVARRAKMSYSLTVTNHSAYGYQDSHGNWGGLLGELAQQKANLAVGPIYPKVMDNVEFFKPVMTTGMKLLVKKPEDESFGASLLLKPFRAEVWVMICIAFIAVALTLFLVGRFSPYEWLRASREADAYNARKTFSLKNSVYFTASTFCWQGYRQPPRSTAGRIAACVWFLFALSVLLAYTASLCVILTTRSLSSLKSMPFLDYDDLVDKGGLKLGAMKYGYLYDEVKSWTSGTPKRLYNYIENSKEWLQDIEEGVQRVQQSKGNYVMLMDSAKADYYSGIYCDLTTYGSELFTFDYTIARANGFPSSLKTKIDMALLELVEDGTVHQLIRKYFNDRRKCPFYKSSKLTPVKESDREPISNSGLNLKDMAVPFLFLFVGILAALVVVGIEIYYKKHQAEKARTDLNSESGTSRGTRYISAPIFKTVKENKDKSLTYTVDKVNQENADSAGPYTEGHEDLTEKLNAKREAGEDSVDVIQENA